MLALSHAGPGRVGALVKGAGRDVNCCGPVLRQHLHLAPSTGATSRLLELEAVPSSAGVARSFVREAFAELNQDSEDVALLLTSELVTNAILHARTPLQVGVLIDDGNALVCVADRLYEGAVLAPLGPSGERSGGRGLALVDALAAAWGTTRYTGGKTVWFQIRTVLDAERRVS